MTAAVAAATDPDAWDAFVAGSANGSFPQLSGWAEANETKGWRSVRMLTETASGAVGAQVLLHRMRPGPWSRGYAPRGPVGTAIDRAAVGAFTGAIRELAAAHRLSHVTVDPELPHDGPVPGWLDAAGWRSVGAIQIDRTRIVDLTHTEAQLWSELRSSARWSVNRARRAGVMVDEAGAAGLDDFERLYLETARRVGFAPSAAYRAVHAAFARRGAARLLLARDRAGAAVATLMLIDCGTRVIEFYGASSAAGARARANHLIKWEAMRSSRERGQTSYDMWGTDQAGLATFKASFGGEERRWIGAWQLVTDDRAYRLVAGAQGVRSAAAAACRRVASLRPGSRPAPPPPDTDEGA